MIAMEQLKSLKEILEEKVQEAIADEKRHREESMDKELIAFDYGRRTAYEDMLLVVNVWIQVLNEFKSLRNGLQETNA